MAVTQVFASIPVRDRAAAAGWYERLAGRPPDLVPNDDEAAWRLTETGWIYVIADPDRAGSALHTLLVDDLDAFLAGLTERGIAAGPVDTIGDGVRRTMVADPDGNRLQLGQPPGERRAMTEADAMQRLWELSDLVSPMAVRIAATLRLPDLIAGGATTAAALAERTGSDPGALRRLLRHLVAIDVLVRRGEDFALTPLSEAMREGRGENRGPLTLDVQSAVARIQLAAVGLLDSIRTGVPAYQVVHGRGFWDDLAADAALGAGFDAFMGSRDQSGFVAAYDWSAVRHVVDVGGGTGARLIAVLRAHPSLRGTLIELPGPAGRATRRFAAEGLGDRVGVVARSFFEPLPAGADVYVLSGVVHDWPDPEATEILRRCAEAAGRSGRVLVVERLLDAAEDMAGETAFDLFMLIACGGRERTLDEFRSLGAAVGLSLRSVLDGPILEFAAAQA